MVELNIKNNEEYQNYALEDTRTADQVGRTRITHTGVESNKKSRQV